MGWIVFFVLYEEDAKLAKRLGHLNCIHWIDRSTATFFIVFKMKNYGIFAASSELEMPLMRRKFTLIPLSLTILPIKTLDIN